MMQRSIRTVAMVLIGVAILGTTVGCIPGWTASNVASFVGGWLAHSLVVPTVPTETCYRNGVQIDCSQLPTDLQTAGT